MIALPRYSRLRESWAETRRDLDAFVRDAATFLKALPRFEVIEFEMQANTFPVDVKTGFRRPPRGVVIVKAHDTSDLEGDNDIYALPRWRWAENGNVRLLGCTGLESGTATFAVTLLVIGE